MTDRTRRTINLIFATIYWFVLSSILFSLDYTTDRKIKIGVAGLVLFAALIFSAWRIEKMFSDENDS